MKIKTFTFFALTVLCVSSLRLAAADADGDEGEVLSSSGAPAPSLDLSVKPDATKPDTLRFKYEKLDPTGLLFLETFDDELAKNWKLSQKERFTGQWKRTLRRKEIAIGDHALRIMSASKHHGISRKFGPVETATTKKPLVVQYEVHFEEGLQCGGAYLKLMRPDVMDKLEDFDNETPYVIMFGPDRCGTTNKVHFILKFQNEKSGEWTEHAAKVQPPVPDSAGSHLYTLRIYPDGVYEILVDLEVGAKGHLLKDMKPPIGPSETIDDPTDEQPADWVDEPTIVDPAATKPEDWDDTQPEEIPDPKAEKPEDWNEDEPATIPDPDAKKPREWNDEVRVRVREYVCIYMRARSHGQPVSQSINPCLVGRPHVVLGLWSRRSGAPTDSPFEHSHSLDSS
eukprot:GHVU01197562.1.p1 GENE.GHVU01197562.1~~GHVU01197562.1.p1  ORF type:complete len:397 (+),score=68.90 GHVU01197562.1:97-1287(+)